MSLLGLVDTPPNHLDLFSRFLANLLLTLAFESIPVFLCLDADRFGDDAREY
jgi:hypothetical protein